VGLAFHSTSFNTSARAYSDLLLEVVFEFDHDGRRVIFADAVQDGQKHGSGHRAMDGTVIQWLKRALAQVTTIVENRLLFS